MFEWIWCLLWLTCAIMFRMCILYLAFPWKLQNFNQSWCLKRTKSSVFSWKYLLLHLILSRRGACLMIICLSSICFHFQVKGNRLHGSKYWNVPFITPKRAIPLVKNIEGALFSNTQSPIDAQYETHNINEYVINQSNQNDADSAYHRFTIVIHLM